MRLALFEPDIPQNAGTMLRMAACLGVGADVIEPCGFLLSDRHLRRAGMDYLDMAAIERHPSWQAFLSANRHHGDRRLILLTTHSDLPYTAFPFRRNDTLLVGRETSGVPDDVHAAVDARVIVPMVAGMRSLNVAVAAAMVLGEALRQTGSFPKPAQRESPYSTEV
ncbi:MAG: tRNA (cytidine(34)-2'-O)-methyltransferase [Rhodospirillales bacterium]|nr:tRNA (cytidine(34)-2'-O)-methyltransferase [Rhodospirillales bacterium]